MNYPIIFLILWTVFMLFMFGQKPIIKYFNLVDKRTLIGSEETYRKLNTLMTNGDVSLYRHEFMSEVRVTLRATYQINKSESQELSISGDSLDGVVNIAYETALAKGFIKE